MTKARNIADLLDANGDVKSASLDNVPAVDLTNLSATNLTSGTIPDARITALDATKLTGSIADARIPASAVSQHAVSFDDNKIVNDISTLALRQASDQNKSAYNTNSQSVDVFQDDTGIDTTTSATRTSDEYVATVYSALEQFTNDSNTVLLLHGDNNLTDSSSNGVTITNNSSVGFDSSNKKLGTHAFSFDGVDDYLSTPNMETVDDAVTAPNTGNYTMEGWFKYSSTSFSGTNRLWSLANSGTPSSGNTPVVSVGRPSGNTSEINLWGYNPSVNWNVTIGTLDTNWHHYTAMRVSGTTYFFLDGVQKGSTTDFEDSLYLQNATVFIGARSGSSGEFFYGYADEIRYSNTNRYSTGANGSTQFTPNLVSQSNGTGNFTGTTITAPSSVSSMGAIITYQDQAGTNALNTDIILQLSADNGSTYSTATLTAMPDFSTGIKMAKVNDLAVTAGTQLKYKINFANQASGSKEARIRGVSLQY